MLISIVRNDLRRFPNKYAKMSRVTSKNLFKSSLLSTKLQAMSENVFGMSCAIGKLFSQAVQRH